MDRVCSKSRQAVAILSESGVVFEEYRYLELGIAEEDLEILASLDGIIRTNEKEFKFSSKGGDSVILFESNKILLSTAAYELEFEGELSASDFNE